MDTVKEKLKLFKWPIAGVGALLFLWLFQAAENKPVPLDDQPVLVEEVPDFAEELPEPVQEVPKEAAVDVKGAVVKPGLYTMMSDERVYDAIQKAGGLTKQANAEAVNLAQKVQDEMVIYVPAAGEQPGSLVSSGFAAAPSAQESSGQALININTADAAGLQELPGIGESKAQAIIDYRETEGAFNAPEDLKNVTGIGDKTFEKLKSLITVQ